jgi:alpha-glucosidase
MTGILMGNKIRVGSKNFCCVTFFVGVFLIVGSSLASATELAATWSLSSPEKHCEISVSLSEDGDLTYEAFRDGKVIIQKSPLGLRRNDQNFDHALVLAAAGDVASRHETYNLFSGAHTHVDHDVNQRNLVFQNTNGARIEIDLAATDEGVAFRYRFPDTNRRVHVVKSESTGFIVPQNARGWLQPYHAAGPYTPAYEDFFFNVSPGEPPPDSRAKAVGWAFPALFHVPDADAWVLFSESGTDESYCGCHLAPDSTGGLYHIAFPLSDEGTKGWTNKFGPEPRFSLPWTMPWRVIIMGKSAGDIAMSSLVTDLAPTSRIADTSWIKPGRASWGWWSYPDGPTISNLFNNFTDFAQKMGWEYTLFDAGWWEPGIKGIAKHAQSKGIAPLAWSFATDFYDAKKRAKKLNEMDRAGVRGVKVDFWCSDRQEAIAAMHALFQEAAARKMLVNLHGCTIPRGWQRTWPNFLTCEAVLGTESYFFEPQYTAKAAELNTVLPFTRNAIGPMDTTPVACSPKKYARTTTAAHELATAIILNSGIIHYADKPEFFEALPAPALQVLRDAPARWDETRCLMGDPGHDVVFARRSGNSWFIAGLNGSGESLPVNLDLSAFHDFSKRMLIAEGTDAAMQVNAVSVPDADSWKHEMPPRGGFILRLDKMN